MSYSVVVAAHPCVAMANPSSNPSPPHKRNPVDSKLLSLERHVLKAIHKHQAFGSFSRKFQRPNSSQLLQLQGGLLRAKPLFSSTGDNATTEKDRIENCCFGEAVDDSMLKEFGSKDMQANRAQLALILMNNDDKKGLASRYVANLKDQYGYGCSTLCLVYNATGETLIYSTEKHWSGSKLFRQPYPAEILNGQWAAFLHVHEKDKPTGSGGAVVYRGKHVHEGGTNSHDILLAWYTHPLSLRLHNKAYCEIGDVDSYKGTPLEDRTNKLCGNDSSFNSSSRRSAHGRFEVDVQTEHGTNSPTFTAIIKLIEAGSSS